MDGKMPYHILPYAIFTLSMLCQCLAYDARANQAQLLVDASPAKQRLIPEALFGIFFEEINHAGAGGLWAELVSNRGFEAGGPNVPSNIEPWSVIGSQSDIVVSTDRTSCFNRNKVALRMDILCGDESSNDCPVGGVGIYNPGFWGMNIEDGKTYKLVLHLRASQSVNISVALSNSNGSQILASSCIIDDASEVTEWKKVELQLVSQGNNQNSRLQLTTTDKGTIWFDQVSLMPVDTYLGHGFRESLFHMIADLKPRFLRFPGGCFVEGEWLRNAFRWRETIGPWEERPGHFGDVWKYWTDDGLGYYEFLQLAEDLSAAPIWVFNNGISHQDEVDTSSIMPFVQDVLDSLEFAKGDSSSTWGSVRARMGHPEPFPLYYVAIGNEDCWKKNYRGNYLKFYYAIKKAYPDIKIISNCDGSSYPLDHPADLYDYHVYTSANSLFNMYHQFDSTSRNGPKAFVSEYAVTGKDAGTGSLLAAVAEAGFLIGLEKNSDVVQMASYAPLFVNANDRRWNPDAIVFNAAQEYGTPSYWVQRLFRESSGATIHPTSVQGNSSNSIVASAITWKAEDGNSFLKIKVVNFGSDAVDLRISISQFQGTINSDGSTKTILTSVNAMDENSFNEPNKVVPIRSALDNVGKQMDFVLSPKSVNAFDISVTPLVYRYSM